jgi:hypothetical protein
MTRKQSDPAPAAAAPVPAPKPATTSSSSTVDLFRKPKEDKRSTLTHEKIADDLAAFQRAGGMIEVLGNTHTLKSIRPPEAKGVAPAKDDAAAAKPAD